MKVRISVFAAVLCLACGSAALAASDVPDDATPQEHGASATEDEHAATDEHETHGEAASHEEHSSHHDRSHIKNEFALFLGATDEHGHDTQFTWGFDYKRRIADRRMALGAFFDHAGGDLRNTVLGGLFVWWPVGNLELYAGPGVEFHNGRNQDGGTGDEGHEFKSEGGEHGGADPNETYFVVRVGVGWDFHVGSSYGIVPTVAVDFVDGEEVWVYGLAATYGW